MIERCLSRATLRAMVNVFVARHCEGLYEMEAQSLD